MTLLLWRSRRAGRELATGTLVGLFVLVYGVCRFLSDALRVNDERVAGLTGAQWMSVVMVPAGIFILWKVRPRLAALAAAEATTVEAADEDAEAKDDEDTGAEDEAGAGVAAKDAAEAEDAPDDVDTPTTAEVAADEEAGDDVAAEVADTEVSDAEPEVTDAATEAPTGPENGAQGDPEAVSEAVDGEEASARKV